MATCKRSGGCAPRRQGARCGPESGATFAGLLVLMAISAILLGAAAESWQSISQRDREEELIFRGEAYRDALEQFYRQTGHFPTKLKELMEIQPRCIRKLYPEPMTVDGHWVLLHSVPAPPGAKKSSATKPGSGAASAGREDADTEDGEGDSGEAEDTSGPTQSRVRMGLPGQASRQQLEGGIILGVASPFSGKAFRNYQGSTEVGDWKFFVQMQSGMAGQAPGGQAGGASGGRPAGGQIQQPPARGGGGAAGRGFPPLGGSRPTPPPGGGGGAGPFGHGSGRPGG